MNHGSHDLLEYSRTYWQLSRTETEWEMSGTYTPLESAANWQSFTRGLFMLWIQTEGHCYIHLNVCECQIVLLSFSLQAPHTTRQCFIALHFQILQGAQLIQAHASTYLSR